VPCSFVDRYQPFGEICCLHLQGRKLISSDLSGTLAPICQTTQCHISKDHNLYPEFVLTKRKLFLLLFKLGDFEMNYFTQQASLLRANNAGLRKAE
jgi:hypothetical protein